MPDQNSASDEHALLQELTAPLASLPSDPVPDVANVEFPVVLRGYDRLAVDAYVKRTSQLVAELNTNRSPQTAVRRALERVGEDVSGILQRAHETAEQITSQSRREAEDRLESSRREAEILLEGARREADDLLASSKSRLGELDAETDRIWEERHRIVEDTRSLAAQLLSLSEAAIERFPADEEPTVTAPQPFNVEEATPVPEETTGVLGEEATEPQEPTDEQPSAPSVEEHADEPDDQKTMLLDQVDRPDHEAG